MINTNNSPTLTVIPPAQFTAVFEDKQQYNTKFIHYSFELKQPHRLQFRAGQYISLAVDDKGNRRSYSIINPPSIDHGVELLLSPLAGGLGSTYLNSLQFGNEVAFLAPLGLFTLQEPDPQTANKEQILVMIATGSGIAPFHSMILEQLQDKQDNRSIYLYWGLRHVEELIWQDEFQRLSEHFPNFKFMPIISQPSDGWTLSRGRVTDLLEVHQFQPNTGFYVCGGQQMVNDTFTLLKAKGVTDECLHKENFDL